MKKLFLVLLLSFSVLPLTVVAQTHKTIPIFWQITKPGSHDTSYILGTYHLASSERVKKIAPVMRAFQRSKVVVGEMIFDESSITSVLPHVMAQRTLKELLPDSDYHYVDSSLEILIGADWQMMQSFKPIALYVTVSMGDAFGDASAEDTNTTMDFMSGMDIFFQTEAKKAHKKLFGFESASEQAAILFDSIPEERQAQGLVEYLRDRNEQDSTIETLEHDYYNGQVAEDLVLEGMEKTERSVLLDDRNKRWLAVLPKYLKQNAFIAVGAGHLGGATGLIAGLRKLGYAVKPLALK